MNAGNTNWVARYQCRAQIRGSHPNATCGHARIQLNTFFQNAVPKIAVACHELGHGVGLHHRGTNDGTTCMNAQVSRGMRTTLAPHELEHLRNHY